MHQWWRVGDGGGDMRGRTKRWVASALAAATVLVAACAPTPTTPPASTTTTTVVDPLPQTPVGDDAIRLNQIQLVGSHNSYHVAPDPQILGLLNTLAGAFPALASGLGDPNALNYTHASIPDQLAAGIRTFELDTWADPTGNRFSNPKLNANFGFHDPQLDYAALAQPGFKVFHIVDIDQRSRCVSLELCLEQIRTFSNAHPDHLPIIINLELKADALPAPLSGTSVLPFDAAQFDALDAQLRDVLGDRLITPDDVRGSAPDLRTAIETTGWPTVADSRGKVLFFLDNEGLRDGYLVGHPTLEGRVLFTSSGEGQPTGRSSRRTTRRRPRTSRSCSPTATSCAPGPTPTWSSRGRTTRRTATSPSRRAHRSSTPTTRRTSRRPTATS